MASSITEEAAIASRIISDAGGEVVGRTKLQKIAYMLEVMGFGSGLYFEYKYYGPYSERLSSGLKYADLFDLIHEDIKTAAWGGTYSIFRNKEPSNLQPQDPRAEIVKLGNEADPVELELAATAVYLAREGHDDPWAETRNRKPEKATDERLERAKTLLEQFKAIDPNQSLLALA